MKSYRINLIFCICCLAVLFLASCSKNKRPLYRTDDISGQWKRVYSSKPAYDSSMYVSINGSDGIIDSTLFTGYFTVGTTKWKSISPDDDSFFVYKDLGSDNIYYPSKMTYIKNVNGRDTLFLEINSNGEGNGSWQYWEKQ